MENFNVNIQKEAEQLLQLFNNKLIDRFVQKCEQLMKLDGTLRKWSKYINIDLDEKYKQMSIILNNFDKNIAIANKNTNDWNTTQIDKNCNLSVRTNSENTLVQLKSSGILPLNVKHILYVTFLMKLYSNNLPFCRESYQIRQLSRLQKLGWVRLSIPIPFIKDRCALLMGLGFDRIDYNNTVCIYAEAVTLNEQFLSKNKIELGQLMKERQPFDLKHFVLQLSCKSSSQTQYTAYALIDHHLNYLPNAILAFVVKQLGKSLFDGLIKKLIKFEETVWAKQIKENYKENADFYDWINFKIKEWEIKISQKK